METTTTQKSAAKEAAKKLAAIAYSGLYDRGERFNNARVAKLGGIELRSAYSGKWIPLLASYTFTDCNGRPVANPIADEDPGVASEHPIDWKARFERWE
jgi:hypothetical protein